jgi:hypothetical protein
MCNSNHNVPWNMFESKATEYSQTTTLWIHVSLTTHKNCNCKVQKNEVKLDIEFVACQKNYLYLLCGEGFCDNLTLIRQQKINTLNSLYENEKHKKINQQITNHTKKIQNFYFSRFIYYLYLSTSS